MKHAREDYNRFQDPALNDPSLLGEGLTPIAEDEPVFILRAQDKHAAKAVRYYAALLQGDEKVGERMIQACFKWAEKMRDWPNQKSPDMP